MDSFFYNVGQGWKNIRRNGMFSFASVLTMTTCLFLFGIMFFVVVNLRFFIREAESNVGITVFFDEGTTVEEIKDLQDKIGKLEGVKLVKYVSGIDAWKSFQENYLTDPELLESFGDDNPLANSSSFEVFFDTVEDQTDLVSEIRILPKVRQVNDTSELVAMLTKTNRIVSISSSVLIGLLLVIALFLISTTISVGVSVRKHEISIMHLIGAAIPIGILYPVYYKVVAFIGDRFVGIFQSGMDVVRVEDVFAQLSPLIVAIGVGLGFLGSYFTMNRELRKIRHI